MILRTEAAATSSHPNLVGVVGRADNRRLALAGEDVGKDGCLVTEVVLKEMFGAVGRRQSVGLVAVVKPASVVRDHISAYATAVVTKDTFFAILLELEIDDTFGLVIFESGEFGRLGLLVDDLHLLNHVGRDIFGSGLYVVAEELLTVNAYGGDGLTVDRYVTLLVDLYAVEFFQ